MEDLKIKKEILIDGETLQEILAAKVLKEKEDSLEHLAKVGHL